MVDYGYKIEEKVKAMESEIKENVQGTIFKKMRRGLGTFRTTLNIPTSESQGCQKERKKSKKWKTYLKT